MSQVNGEMALEVVSPRGYSAYEIAAAHGFTGTEAQWLASLHGDSLTWNGKAGDALGDIKGYAGDVPMAADDPTTVKSKIESMEEDAEDLQTAVAALQSQAAGKLEKANVYNALDKTAEGFALDARQGAALNEAVAAKANQSELTALQTAVNGKVTGSVRSVVLTLGGWAACSQSVEVTGVTAGNTVLTAPVPGSFAQYAACGIRCTAQAEGMLTFVCDSVPTVAVGVNVQILNGMN